MNGMRLRLLAMGTILSLLGVGLLAARGLGTAYFGLLAVGFLLLVLGALWRSQGLTGPADRPEQR